MSWGGLIWFGTLERPETYHVRQNILNERSVSIVGTKNISLLVCDRLSSSVFWFITMIAFIA